MNQPRNPWRDLLITYAQKWLERPEEAYGNAEWQAEFLRNLFRDAADVRSREVWGEEE